MSTEHWDAELAAKRMDKLEAENALLTAQVAMQAEVLREVRGFFAARETVLSSIIPWLDSALSATAETVDAWKRESVQPLDRERRD